MSYISNNSIIKLTRVLGSAIIIFSSQQAAASPTGPLDCGGFFGVGGCAPYGQVIFDTGSHAPLSGSLFEYDDVILDYGITGASAHVRGVVDLASGTLKVVAEGIEDGNPSTSSGGFVIASATDVFTLHSPSASGSVTFSVILTADGVGTISNYGYSGQASVQLGTPGGGVGEFDSALYQALEFNGILPGVQFALLSTHPNNAGNQLRASDTHSVLLDTPFSLSYSLRANVSQGTTFNLLNTGHLSFILPAGVSITSMGGYSAGDTTVVPVPASAWLLGSGLLTVFGVQKYRRKLVSM